MKKFLLAPFIALAIIFTASFLRAADEPPQEQPEEYVPLFASLDNSQAVQNDMLSNTYIIQIRDEPPDPNDPGKKVGGLTGFRLHKNWFLTCAHGIFLDMNKQHKPSLPINIQIHENPNAHGTSAPFILFIDITKPANQANGRIFYFNPRLRLNSTNTNRGDDFTLIYIPDEDTSKPQYVNMKKQFKEMLANLEKLRGTIPDNLLNQMKKNITTVHKREIALRENFQNYPIKPFHLFVLDEKTVINELGFPGVTSYSFPLTAYHLHRDSGLIKFQFVPKGTHKGTHAIFYDRVTDLIPGTSGSPMTYGNFVVSIVSATNCSPMITEKVQHWIKNTMKKDYKKGMCVKANIPPNSALTPVHAEVPSDWNQG